MQIRYLYAQIAQVEISSCFKLLYIGIEINIKVRITVNALFVIIRL